MGNIAYFFTQTSYIPAKNELNSINPESRLLIILITSSVVPRVTGCYLSLHKLVRGKGKSNIRVLIIAIQPLDT